MKLKDHVEAGDLLLTQFREEGKPVNADDVRLVDTHHTWRYETPEGIYDVFDDGTVTQINKPKTD